MKKTILFLLFALTINTISLFAQEYHLGQVIDNPDGSRGVVFYLNEDGTEGWMVALHDASTNCPWGPTGNISGIDNITITNYEFLTSIFQDVDGYDHTQQIREYCQNNSYADPYAAGLVDFENGWYLPSAGQLKWLYVNAIFYESELQNVGEKMGLHGYWSSSLQTNEKAWYVQFGAPYPETSWASNGYFGVIPRNDYVDEYGRNMAVRAVRNLDFSPLPTIGTLQAPSNICDEGPLELVEPNLSNTDNFGWEIAQDDIFTFPVEYTGQSLDTTYNGWFLRLWASNEEGTKYSNAVPISVFKTKESHTTVFSCDPYTWNDTTYTESGIYQKTFTTVYGCDSIANLHLTVGADALVGDIQGQQNILYSINGPFTYSIDSVPGAFGYEWQIDNNWPISFSHDSPQCNVNIYTKDKATLTVRVYTRCGFVERSLLIHHDLEPEVTIFPNPNNGKFNINLFGFEGGTTIEVYDYLGQLIDRFEVSSLINGYTIPYSLTGHAAGMYLICIRNRYDRYYKKVIKNYAGSYGVIY